MKYKKLFKKILIIDGSYQLHRCLSQPGLWELTTPDDSRKTGGIFGTIRLVNSELRKTDAFPIVVFDNGLSRRRLEVDPTYKRANEREINKDEVLTPDEAKEDYITQYRFSRSFLTELFPMVGIPTIKMVPWEGDDLMYIISRMAEEATILTDDRDLLQLLDNNIHVRRPKANENYTIERFLQETGYRHMYEFIMQKAICGDGSDNIGKSCTGVAEGTAPTLIKLLENTVLQNKDFPKDEKELRTLCENLNLKYKKAFLNFDKEKYENNLKLVDLNLVDGDVDQQLIDSIVAKISNCENMENSYQALVNLSQLGINEIYPDEIIQAICMRRKNLFI